MKKNYSLHRRKRIMLCDFGFKFTGHGHYLVTYYSPVTNKYWSHTVSDMTLIDRTKNADEPKVKDLDILKRVCKTGRAY